MHSGSAQSGHSGDVDSEADGAAVVDAVGHSPSIDLELMAADETLEGDEDGKSVQSVHAKDDGGEVEWQGVVGQESETTTTLTAAAGRRQARGGGDVDDDDAVFGQLIVRELRHINDPETKLLLRHNILTLIYEARLGSLHSTRGGGGVQPSWPSLPRLNQGDRRPCTLPTINGCWSSVTRAQSTNDDVDSADAAAVRRQNHIVTDDGKIVIKEEME